MNINVPLQQIAIDFIDSRSSQSFTLLYNRLKPGLKKFIMKFHKDMDVVDEILAVTLSKVYIYVDKYDSQWNFSTWIYKICQNECLMEIRRQNSNVSFDSLVDTSVPKAIRDSDWKNDTEYEFYNKDESIQSDSMYANILEEIENLPDHYKEIIADRIVDKLKYKEIALKRGLNINTVRSRIHSAKKVIKTTWIDKKIKDGSSKINIIGVTVLNILDGGDKEEHKEKPTLVEVDRTKDDNTYSIIEFTSAKYGSDTVHIDVLEHVKVFFYKYDKITATNKLAGDPCKGYKKKLFLEYVIDGVPYTININEGTSYNIGIKCTLKK